MTIKEIREFLQSGQIADGDTLTQYHRILGGKYAYLSEQFSVKENIKNFKTEQIRERKDVKSDARAERIFLATEEGQEWTYLKNELKAIGKMMSSINKSIERANLEYQGQQYN